MKNFVLIILILTFAPTTNANQLDFDSDPEIDSMHSSFRFKDIHLSLDSQLIAQAKNTTRRVKSVDPCSQDPDYCAGIWFDEPIRELLRAESNTGRTVAKYFSDGLVGTLIAYPFVVETFSITQLHQKKWQLGWRMIGVDALATAVTFGAMFMTKNLVDRPRPYYRECYDNPDGDFCDSDDSHDSFFSGHASMAFVGAGLVCSHANQIGIYGNDGANIAACAISMGGAAATGILRIVADKHYSTDVLTGAAIGLLAGLGIPALIGYGNSQPVNGSASPMNAQQPILINWGGQF